MAQRMPGMSAMASGVTGPHQERSQDQPSLRINSPLPLSFTVRRSWPCYLHS